MKLTKRGFTLVELMIVIAIIGILAAALFPSMTNYLKRSRDAARTANLKDIATAIGAYYADKEVYPDAAGASANCVNSGTLVTYKYMDKVPVDPVASRTGVNGCTGGSDYGYGSGSNNGTPMFSLAAVFENPNGGNTGSVTSYVGVLSPEAMTSIQNGFTKGTGSGYIVAK